jgi:hypothetical protein
VHLNEPVAIAEPAAQQFGWARSDVGLRRGGQVAADEGAK